MSFVEGTDSSARSGFEPATFTQGLANAARQHLPTYANNPALSSAGRTRTYRDLENRTDRLAGALADLGVGPGDRVAILDKNSAELIETMIAAAKLGAVGIPLNWRLSASELQVVLDDATPTALLVHAEFGNLASQFRTDAAVLHCDTDPTLSDFERRITASHPIQAQIADDWQTVVLQLYTSGTTGDPKGVQLTNCNIAHLTQIKSRLNIDGSAVVMAASPLFHIAGMGAVLIGLAAGAHTLVMRDSDPHILLKTMVTEQVTYTFLVPSVIKMICDLPEARDADFSALRSLGYGGAPMTPALLKEAMATLGAPLFQLYGLTETTGGVTELHPRDHDANGSRSHLLRSVGRPYPWVELRIADPAGEDVPVGESGEILLRSAQIMPGYFGRPKATSEAIGPQGWFRTGDLGHFDNEGYVYLDDRLKDMVISGGENVYPAQVEAVLAEHPSVSTVAVVGTPDAKWGELVTAFVVARTGHDPTPDQIIDWTRGRIAGYKRPRKVVIVPELPHGPTGKILKRNLREHFSDHSGDA